MKFKNIADARLFVLTNNTILIILGIIYFGLQRSNLQIFGSIATAILTEFLWNLPKILKSKDFEFFNFQFIYNRIISSSLAGVSLLILIKSNELWFYPILAFIGISSKYLIRMKNKTHIFNPTNFAIVAALCLFPDFLQVRPDQFSSSPWLMIMTIFFGILATFFGSVWRTTLGYFSTILLIGLPIGNLVLNVKPLWILYPEINISTIIFTFLMLTDPKTAPINTKFQFLFGSGVALIHLWMRWKQIPFSPFIALFVMTALKSFIQTLGNEPLKKYNNAF
jgi:hypothetical protein